MGNRMGTRRIDLHTLHDGDLLRWNDTTKRLEGVTLAEVGAEDVPDDGVTLAVGGQDGIPLDVTLSADGTKLFILGNSTDSVYEYTLPSPFLLTGASYAGRSKSVNAQTPNMGAVAFNDDGTKMYIGSGSAPGTVYQYTLATPWNVTTATYDGVSLALTTEGIQANGIGFTADGTKMFVAGGNGAGASSIHQFSLTALP